MQYFDEIEVKVLHVTEKLDIQGDSGMPVEGKPDYLELEATTLPYIPQSEDYPVTGLKGLREQVDMLLAALKVTGLMEFSNKEKEGEA